MRLAPLLLFAACTSGKDVATTDPTTPTADGDADTDADTDTDTGHDTCFAAGTRVATPGGDRDLAHLGVGDRVVGFDLTARRARIVTLAAGSHTGIATRWLDLVVGGRVLRVTPGHLFLLPRAGEWRVAGDLRPGDELLVGAELRPVTSVRPVTTTLQPTFNLELPAGVALVAEGVVAYGRSGGVRPAAPGWRAAAGAAAVAFVSAPAVAAASGGGWIC
jgi:hypothetical protein